MKLKTIIFLPDLITLDSVKSNKKIRIPYEYKKEIKTELDVTYNVNETTVYPELLSLSTYIREKYKEKNISIDGSYSIMKVQDTSHPRAKRVSIDIVLNKQLEIKQIYEIA